MKGENEVKERRNKEQETRNQKNKTREGEALSALTRTSKVPNAFSIAMSSG
jgi:hypothetical protein